VRIGPFRFNLRELAGSMGDFGTLLPLVIGYITVCGMNPAGLLVMLGAANIATGLLYRLPMPLQPMKVLAVMPSRGHGRRRRSTPPRATVPPRVLPPTSTA
jgi:hypothetical protein